MKKIWKNIEYQILKVQYTAKSFFGNICLRKRMLCIFSLAIVPLCISTIFLTIFLRNNMKKQVIEASDNTIYLMSVSMNQLLESIEESAIQIISMPAVTSFLQKDEEDPVVLYHRRKELEENYMKPILGAARYISSIEFEAENVGESYSFGYNRSGSRSLSSQEYEDAKLLNNKEQRWFYIKDVYHGETEIAIVYRRQIYEFGTSKKLGTIYVEVSGQNFLKELMHEFNYLGNAEIQLVGSDSNVIVGDQKFISDEKMGIIYRENLVPESKNARMVKKIEGDNYILNYSMLANGWWIVHIVPYDEIFHSTDKMFKIILAIFAFIVISIIFFIIEISQEITRPIELLEKSMEDVKKGDFSKAVPVVSNDEIGRLCEGFNLMIQKINDLFHEFEEEQRMKNKAELHSLQSQITPHFLYNILNSLMCDAMLKGEYEYSQTIGSLINLLKKSLDYTKEYIMVEDEIELLEDYLILQKFRYRNKFEYSIELAEEAKKCRSLKLILQPVAENCILHGMGSAFMKIMVNVEKKDGDIWIWITDDGVGLTEELLSKVRNSFLMETIGEEHVGLKNINRRIQLHFGEKYGVRIYSDNGITKVVIFFPALDGES